MLGLDGAKQKEWREAAAREKAAAERQKELAQEILSNTITVEDDNGRDVSDLVAQMGRPMASEEVIRRLKLCNQRLIFIKHPRYELYGIYIKKLERNSTGGFSERQIHVCGMESGIMPEFSVLHKTTKKVPNPDGPDWLEVPTFLAETRGWRTVLIRLLKAGLISKYQAEFNFGWSPSVESRKWHEQANERIAL